MTHEVSVFDGSQAPSDDSTATYRVEAHNRRESPDETERYRFDFHLTRTEDSAVAYSTVVDLFAAYLGVAGPRLDTEVQSPLRITRVSVEGDYRLADDDGAGPRLVTLEACVHVESSRSPDALETWRTALRDDVETQQLIPPGVPFSLQVVQAS